MAPLYGLIAYTIYAEANNQARQVRVRYPQRHYKPPEGKSPQDPMSVERFLINEAHIIAVQTALQKTKFTHKEQRLLKPRNLYPYLLGSTIDEVTPLRDVVRLNEKILRALKSLGGPEVLLQTSKYGGYYGE